MSKTQAKKNKNRSPLDVLLSVSMTQPLKAAIRDAARREGTSTSAWVRAAAQKALKST